MINNITEVILRTEVMTQYEIPTTFHLSDAVSKLNEMDQNEMDQNEMTGTYSIDGYPETVRDLKYDLEDVIDLSGDLFINEIEGEDAIAYLRKILGE